MSDQTTLPPRTCVTAVGMLVSRRKIVLVKHKKLGIWLAPGGHLDDGELPHQAAEREFYEETGVKAEAVNPNGLPILTDTESQYVPNPFLSNLHWVNQDIYQARLNSPDPTRPWVTETWPRGCEQHLALIYLLRPTGSVDFIQNHDETEGIAWFGLEDIDGLESSWDIKSEIQVAFSLASA